jgi:hypothetical protein
LFSAEEVGLRVFGSLCGGTTGFGTSLHQHIPTGTQRSEPINSGMEFKNGKNI